MTDLSLEDLVAGLRQFGAEATSVEAKLAQGGLPKSARESVSAFSNTPGGGVIIMGLNEGEDFRADGVSEPAKMMADFASLCSDEFVPPVRPELSVESFEGVHLIVAKVAELPKSQKPCYIKSLGMARGSFIRVGEGDRRLTSEEVNLLLADRGQPMFDHEVIADATRDDLDTDALDRYVARLRTSKPRLFATESHDRILRMTNVLKIDEAGAERPTLAGLLAMGRYPQQQFPQLNLTFVSYPTVSGDSSESGVRFLDNASIDGPIPVMVVEALAAVRRNMTRRALIDDAGGRRDVWEYPPEALREAIVNALVHRDLSPGSRGIQVQIEMYPDRLLIKNPGGLFGAIDISKLGEEGRSSARNGLLLKLLEDVTVQDEDRTVCENRGSGIRAMIAALLQAGMSPPKFTDRTTSFDVVLPNHTLLDDDTVAWLRMLGRDGLRDSQCIALAYMRRGEVLDNSKYRAATGISDSRVATFELQDLVAREFVTQTGTRGGARYSLSDYAATARPDGKRARPNRRIQIVELLFLHSELSKAEISEELLLNPKTVEHWLRVLKSEDAIEATAPGRGSKHTKYRLAEDPFQEVLFTYEGR